MNGHRIIIVLLLTQSIALSLTPNSASLSLEDEAIRKHSINLTCASPREAWNVSWSAHCSTTNSPSNESLETVMKAPLNASSEESNPPARPRIRFCNVPDEEEVDSVNATGRRVRRYSLHGNKWEKTDLTWTLRTPSSRVQQLPQGVIRQQIYAAMKVWERESTLTFTEVHKDTPDVDIYIDFLTGDHNDGYKFDGPGGTLAHAFYPGKGRGGDMHFDDTESFVAHHEVKKFETSSLLVTAAHELGHSLGLRHSDVENALMAPFYQEYPADFRLPNDDKYGIQALYGRPPSEIPTTIFKPLTTTEKPPTTPYRPPTTPYRPPTTPYRPPTTPYRPPHKPITPDRPPVTPTTPRTPPTTPRTPPTTPRTPPTTTRRTPYTVPPVPPTIAYVPPTTKPPVTPTTLPPESPSTPPPPPCPSETPSEEFPDACDTDFDAVTRYHGEYFFFKGKFYWRVSSKGQLRRNESPNEIWYRFSDLPRSLKRIDAVYVTRKDTFVFFSGPTYYELGPSFRMKSTGKLVDLGVNANHLDAAMVWGHNGRIYMFSGNHYWRIGWDGHAEADYPRDVAVWRGLPSNYSAAFTVRSLTYFLAGRVFWSFDNLQMRISEPPLLIAPYWFSCPHYNPEKVFLCSPVATSVAGAPPSLHLHACLWLAVICLVLIKAL
nr:matrix metalloproteinase-25-like [Procambarus clarkii]